MGKKYGKCQIVGCKETAKWGIYKKATLEKKIFLHVCDKCEKEIGDENEDSVEHINKIP